VQSFGVVYVRAAHVLQIDIITNSSFVYLAGVFFRFSKF